MCWGRKAQQNRTSFPPGRDASPSPINEPECLAELGKYLAVLFVNGADNQQCVRSTQSSAAITDANNKAGDGLGKEAQKTSFAAQSQQFFLFLQTHWGLQWDMGALQHPNSSALATAVCSGGSRWTRTCWDNKLIPSTKFGLTFPPNAARIVFALLNHFLGA